MKNMNDPKDKAPSHHVRDLDKAWEHVTQHVEENGKKVFVCNFCSKEIRINRVKKHLAACTLVHPDVRFAIEGSLKQIDHKPKEDDVNTTKVQKGRMVKTRNGARRSKEVAECSNNTGVGDHLVAGNELRTIIAEEVRRAIQAAMPAILEQNTEITCKMIEDRIRVHKQVNEDVVVVEKEDFSDCMPEFIGLCEPISSLRWILEMENIFKAIKCDDGDKVVYAVSKLRLEAKSWWDVVKDTCGPTTMTWSRFKEVFKEKFCPISVVMQQEDVFLTFKQENQSVKEYTAHFVDKARFVEHLVATEEIKIERYIRGLRIDIMELISKRKLVTFWDAVEAAQDIENIIVDRGVEENNDNDMNRKRGRSGDSLNNEHKKTRKKVSFSDKNELFVFDSSKI